MPYSRLFFDLDDTLYPPQSGLWPAIQERMNEYMHSRLGLDVQEIPAIRRGYYETYGTTLQGLQRHHQVDADDFLTYVHDLPIESYIKPTPQLRELLLSLPQPRWIFTNASAGHAWRVMNTLGVDACFEGVIDIKALGFACKPSELAYRRALELTGSDEPQGCVLFDDTTVNLAPARKLGFTTVLVGGNGQSDPAANFTVRDLLTLPQAIPGLWDVGAETGDG